MKCHVCGSKMNPIETSLPFKLTENTIVIMKNLPVLMCQDCTEYVLEDSVMERLEQILEKVNSEAELEVIQYAA